jgi:hypothetical protein
MVMAVLSIGAVSFMNSATHAIRTSVRQTEDIQTTHLCEAGVQSVLRVLWRDFKIVQHFENMDEACIGAGLLNPRLSENGSVEGVGRYSAGVVSITTPADNQYVRMITVRAVGYLDQNGNETLDEGEPAKTIDVTARFELARSSVFDYTYFVNNYGWMDGFRETDLYINGDMRANGNVDFLNGSPTVNGSIVAANNDKLSPPAPGLINMAPVKQSNATYSTSWSGNARTRQVYDPARHGAKGTAEYEKWRDFIYESDASVVNNRVDGCALMDSTGTRGWNRTSAAGTTEYNVLDTEPTKELIMPDLADLEYYKTLSQNYRNPKQFYNDGTANPNFNQPAYVEVYDSVAKKYVRISDNGVVTGSAALIGSSTYPIRIHGPVTFTQDCVIRGVVQGQGTIYAGRNVHIVGSITYKSGPDFRGSNMQTIDNTNEKRDMMGLCARGSIIMGNPKSFKNPYPLKYMTPPFTKGRYDENGNWIPPYDATQVDETGMKRYQSVMGDDYLNSIAQGVNTVDAILYTNFVGGGNVGTGGGGTTFNGTIICKDEAIVAYSIPIRMNYDHRIRERSVSKTPLIDLRLPRSPVMLRATWQERYFRK